MLFNDASIFESITTIINVNANANHGARRRRDTDASSGELVITSGTSNFTLSANSIMTVQEGGVGFTQQSTVTIDHSQLLVVGGFVDVEDGARVFVAGQSTVGVSGGSLTTGGSSVWSISNSAVTVNSGNLAIGGAASFSVGQQSVVTVNSGVLSANGASFSVSNSAISVSGASGGIALGGSVAASLSNANITLSGGGTLASSGSASLSVSSSNIAIGGGNLDINGGTASFSATQIVLNAGQVYFSASATVYLLDHSQLTVNGGSLSILGSNNVVLDGSSHIAISGGNLVIQDKSLQLGGSSCIDVSHGNLVYSGSSVIAVGSGCFRVSGGSALFNDHTSVTFTSGGLLQITSGSFVAHQSASVLLDSNSHVDITGGNFALYDSAHVALTRSSSVSISGGNALWFGNSTTLIDTGSSFTVAGGDVEFQDASLVTLRPGTSLAVLLGSLESRGTSHFDVQSAARVLVTGGLFALYDASSITIEPAATVEIAGGNLLLAENATASFTDTTVLLNDGEIGLLEASSASFMRSVVTIDTGSVYVLQQSTLTVSQSTLAIGGALSTNGDSNTVITFSDLTLTGDFETQDAAAFSISDSTWRIVDGNFVARNDFDAQQRKELAVSRTTLTVSSATATSESQGQMQIVGYVDLNLVDSSVEIAGSLTVFGESVVSLTRSRFLIPNGNVVLDAHGRITLDAASHFENQGYLEPPGVIEWGVGTAALNGGTVAPQGSLQLNCQNTDPNGALMNLPSGIIDLTNSPADAAICIGALLNNGVVQLAGASVTYRQMTQQESGIMHFDGSNVTMTDNQPLNNNGGTLAGSLTLNGHMINNGVVSAVGNNGMPTQFVISGDFISTPASTIYFVINNLDLSSAGAITTVNADHIGVTNATACVCINPLLPPPPPGTSVTLMNAVSALEGEFSSVSFECALCADLFPTPNIGGGGQLAAARRRSLTSVHSGGCVHSSYGARSFAILFAGCDGSAGGGGLSSISPSWYIILPIAVGLIIAVIVLLGGALFIDARMRAKQMKKRTARKRMNALAEYTTESAMNSGASSTV